MNSGVLRVLVDTNVWLTLFEDPAESPTSTASLFAALVRSEAALYSAATSLKDVFYLHQRDMKLRLRKESVPLSENEAAAVRESAWACVRSIMELSIVVPIGQREALQATVYRQLHDDFEDDLVLAAAKRIEADYLVTFDVKLQRHAPFACLTPADMLVLLRAESTE